MGELGDEHAAILAHHWREAEEWEQALHHTLRAAARARALYARQKAIALHWQALELLPRLPITTHGARPMSTSCSSCSTFPVGRLRPSGAQKVSGI